MPDNPGSHFTVFPTTIPVPDQIDSPRSLVESWKEVRGKLILVMNGIPEEVFGSDPAKPGWSAGQNAEHLFRTQKAFSRLVPAALSRRLGLDANALRKWPYLPLFRRASEPGKAKNPEEVTPKDHWSKTESFAKLAESMQSMEKSMEGRTLQELANRGFPHPLFGPISLLDWCFVLVAHEIAHGKSLERKYALQPGTSPVTPAEPDV